MDFVARYARWVTGICLCLLCLHARYARWVTGICLCLLCFLGSMGFLRNGWREIIEPSVSIDKKS